ncbi:2-oxoglutarate dehydrogenase, E2 component, dihydrolipoamide succinyltransferase, partial [Salsipaludibacter albus]|uniref:2-oxoglutarate dehydrogenase, E2 component, dihydrolipoamide succinyltransferase n=1 Tax=Salsipaludibacter albus TaxID=2849650 RepID=UPI001EE4A162
RPDRKPPAMANVELPQLGESVTEGVVTAWLVEVGDTVEVDEPIVEVSTDKVDTEIPSPVAGVVQELKAEVDDTIEVGQVIAVIGEDEGADTDGGGDGDGGADGAEGEPSGAPEDEATSEQVAEEMEAESATDEDEDDDESADDDAPAESTSTTSAPSSPAPSGGDTSSSEAVLTSPLVRKLLREAGIDAARVEGTGPGGRITRADAEAAIADPPADATSGAAPATDQPAAGAGVTPAPVQVAAVGTPDRPRPSPTQVDFQGQREVVQDLTRVRKAIAKGMMDSLQSTAQLTAAVEVDMTAIMNLRAAVKDDFKAREGASLSPLPFAAKAVLMTIPRHPTVNARMDLDAGTATYYRHVNLGMAVDTERGLLVPNIKDAQDMTVAALARNIADIAKRTRDKKISPDEIQGGTFTITNTGSLGTLFDTPILNAPEAAILATAAIEKRPVVVSDAWGDSIAIRWMTYLCMTYDHRILDGADAARFLQDLKWVIENHDWRAEVGV